MTAQEHLDAAVAAGLTFADCVKTFAARNTARDLVRIANAREQHHQDGEVEIDDVTVASGSEGEGGDYVLAWVWASDDDRTEI